MWSIALPNCNADTSHMLSVMNHPNNRNCHSSGEIFRTGETHAPLKTTFAFMNVGITFSHTTQSPQDTVRGT
jgi:hypothetical protein